MRQIERTGQFKRDYKREAKWQHRATLDADLVPVLVALADDQPLEPRHRDHALTGDWKDHRDCHVKPDLVQIVTELEQRGIGFESVTERIETGSATGKLTFHLFSALAEFERNLIRERTQAGLAAARARGRKGGRKPALDAKQVREIKALLRDPDIQVADVAKRYGVSRATIYKHVGAVRPERGASPMI